MIVRLELDSCERALCQTGLVVTVMDGLPLETSTYTVAALAPGKAQAGHAAWPSESRRDVSCTHG